jgi:hypothetical protein
VIGILYNAIMHNMDIGQIHCVDLLMKTQTKLTLYFSSISTNFYLISMLGIFLRIFKLIIEFGKEKSMNSTGLKSVPRSQPSRCGGLLQATDRNSRVDRGARPSQRSGWPGSPCRLGALMRTHGHGHSAQD